MNYSLPLETKTQTNVSPNNNTPVFFVHTGTGDISVYPDRIVRKVKMMQAGPNNPVGEVTIPMNEIVQVEVNENGFQRLLTFKTAGSSAKMGMWAGRNSQAFPRKNYQDAQKIREYVENTIMNRPTTGTTIQQQSAADELMKFKQLLDCGVISQEEFNAKKRQLLGL
ncbi:MAG: SHOCT domain-containing protein [Clostridia bacterium]|nr:SHOCT domain-containing protein [Clostridia bacterium]